MSMNFVAATPDAFDLGTALNLLANAGGATLCTWLAPASTPAASMQILYLSVNGGVNSRFEKQLNGGTRFPQAFVRAPDANPADTGLGSVAVPIDGLAAPNRHCAIVYDITNSLMLFYDDGAFTNSVAAAPGGNFSNSVTGTLNEMGTGGSLSNQPFDGMLGDIRVYNRALTAEEIACIYQMRGHDGITDGLELRYGLNEQPTGTAAAAANVRDLSPLQAVPTPNAVAGAPAYRENFMAMRGRV